MCGKLMRHITQIVNADKNYSIFMDITIYYRKILCYNNEKSVKPAEVDEMEYKRIKEEKFEEIYRTFQNDVYRISLYYIKDMHTAQDITQKVFYQFYMHYENINPDSVRAYLFRSARNLSYNWIRDTKREVGGEYLDVMPEENVPQYSTEDEYIRDEHEREAKEFVSFLMEQLREENESWYNIVNLIYCMEKPHDEVAKELGISREALYNKLYRAKKWMRKKFETEYKKL